MRRDVQISNLLRNEEVSGSIPLSSTRRHAPFQKQLLAGAVRNSCVRGKAIQEYLSLANWRPRQTLPSGWQRPFNRQPARPARSGSNPAGSSFAHKRPAFPRIVPQHHTNAVHPGDRCRPMLTTRKTFA